MVDRAQSHGIAHHRKVNFHPGSFSKRVSIVVIWNLGGITKNLGGITNDLSGDMNNFSSTTSLNIY